MATHTSATAHEATPHAIQTTRTATITNSLERVSGREVSSEHSEEHTSSEFDSNDGLCEDKLERLVAMICGTGEESAAALLVLMGILENSAHPSVVANTAKHLAFTHCGELNVYGMVDAQIAVIERELRFI